MLPKNTKLSDLANAIGMPDQTAVNNRNALKAKRYDEMLVEIATLEARIKELEAALENIRYNTDDPYARKVAVSCTVTK